MARALEAQHDPWFTAPHDEEWRSSCELEGQAEGATVRWRPARQTSPVDFSHLENALECPIHADIKTYYGRYWAGGIEAQTVEGHVSLIQLWNYDDYERLVGNLIGHALAKRRAKEAFTVFFATTDPERKRKRNSDAIRGSISLVGEASSRPVTTDLPSYLW